MAAHGGPIGHPRDSEIRLIGEFHGRGRRRRSAGGSCTEDQVEPCLIPAWGGSDDGRATAQTGLLRAEGVTPNRKGRKGEATSCACLGLHRTGDTLALEPYRGVS